MELKSTEELTEIFHRRDTNEWVPEAFEIIEEILGERSEKVRLSYRIEKIQTGTKCYNHEGKEATATCHYCRRQLCSECVIFNRKGKSYHCKNENDCLAYQEPSLEDVGDRNGEHKLIQEPGPSQEGQPQHQSQSKPPAASSGTVVQAETDQLSDMEGATSGSEVLLEAARPDLYRVNAFRIAGLPVDATARDISRQAEKLKVMEKLGGTRQANGPLPLDPAPDSDAMREAMQRLHDPERRLVDEFFWFWPHQLGQSKSDEALAALGRGDVKGAAEIWAKQENYHSDSNISMHNLAVLSHTAALDLEHVALTKPLLDDQKKQRDSYWLQAFRRWKILLQYEGFWSRLTARIRELDDPRLTTGTARRMRVSLPLALLSINAQLAVRAAERGDTVEAHRHIEIMKRWEESTPKDTQQESVSVIEIKTCPTCGQVAKMDVIPGALWCSWCGKEVGNAAIAKSRGRPFLPPVVEEALRRAVEPIRERIKTLCKTAEPEADADPAHADQVTKRLLEQTRPVLTVLDTLLPAGNPTRDGAHDEVALRALACQIPFGNKTENWKVSLKLLEQTLPIAASESARERIQQNIRTVKANLDYQLQYGTCWFCKQPRPEDAAVAEVKMYGNVIRTPTREGARIQWQNMTVKVPRCKRCNVGHARNRSFPVVGGVLGGFVGVAGCAAAGGDPGVGFWLLLIGYGVGNAIGRLIARANRPSGIKSESAKTNFPGVKTMISQGWAIGEKPAGVQ